MKFQSPAFAIFILLFLLAGSCKKEQPGTGNSGGNLQLTGVSIGGSTLAYQGQNKDVPSDKQITINFTGSLDTNSVRKSITLETADNSPMPVAYSYQNSFKTAVLSPLHPLGSLTGYTLQISKDLRGIHGESFPGVSYTFTTIAGSFSIDRISLNGVSIMPQSLLKNVNNKKITVQAHFTQPIDSSNYKSYFMLSGSPALNFSLSDTGRTVIFSTADALKGYTSYSLYISTGLSSINGYTFAGFGRSFLTGIDSTYKFPEISDDDLLTLVEQQTFKYFWDFGHPDCGLARERNSSGDVVTLGGSGFGIMAMAVAMNRGFITRDDGLSRLSQILGFLETCDRFHGAWPHWINGVTGKTVPFSQKDDGADLVETSFMLEGLLTMRQYLDSTVTAEKNLQDRITALFNAVEFDWFTQGQQVLYWHWSPDYGFAINMPIHGWDEALIVYVLAASSPTHGISKAVYDQGWAMNGAIENGKTFYSYTLPLGEDYGGPLFFTHYSFMGLDPRNLQDTYANYWEQNMNHALINWSYCKANPQKYLDYSSSSWGLTACDIPSGYGAQSPTNDIGVIAPTAALSSFPYTPVQSMDALKHFYYLLGNKLWGEYGFYDAYDISQGWWASSFLAIDEGPIVCMIENYRTQLLWNAFMSAPEIQMGLTKLGFTY